jgi:hypothetical protein
VIVSALVLSVFDSTEQLQAQSKAEPQYREARPKFLKIWSRYSLN